MNPHPAARPTYRPPVSLAGPAAPAITPVKTTTPSGAPMHPQQHFWALVQHASDILNALELRARGVGAEVDWRLDVRLGEAAVNLSSVAPAPRAPETMTTWCGDGT